MEGLSPLDQSLGHRDVVPGSCRAQESGGLCYRVSQSENGVLSVSEDPSYVVPNSLGAGVMKPLSICSFDGVGPFEG